jgi:hypothetical protein
MGEGLQYTEETIDCEYLVEYKRYLSGFRVSIKRLCGQKADDDKSHVIIP